MDVTDFEDLLSSSSMHKIIDTLFDKSKLEMITRIRDIELDKLARMLYFGKKLSEHKNKISNLEKFVKLHLALRLSLDSKSREEIAEIFTSLIKTNVELEKKED